MIGRERESRLNRSFTFHRPRTGPKTGLWLKVRAKNGKVWIGVFAFGYNSPPAFSRVLSSPDPERLCVVSAGSAYIVNAEQPEMWEKVPINPALDVRPLREEGLLLFADFTNLAAYGNGEIAWRSQRLRWDDLKITDVTAEVVEGTGYDATTEHKLRFAVDLRTGNSLLPSPFSPSD